MNPFIFSPFALVDIGVKLCFCGKPTVEDHDFCFCSPECAREDSLRALGGQDDCHYRKVMQMACTNSTAPEHALLRHKSENQLRSVSIARRASRMSQNFRHPKPTREKTLPTLEEVTSSLLTGQEGCEDRITSVRGSRRPFVSRNESIAPTPLQQSPPPQRTLKRSLHSKAGLNKGIRDSTLAMFHDKIPQTASLNMRIRKESSVTAVILQEMAEENDEEAAAQRFPNRTEDGSRPPSLAHHKVRSTTAIRRSGGLRRSASFAGWNSQIENPNGFEDERGHVMESVFQLRQAWNNTPEITRDKFDEMSDEED